MHELAAVKSIHDIVLRHAQKASADRVLSVNLEIGALSDLQDEWVHRYFDHLSRGTIAEGAVVGIVRVPGVFRCNDCETVFEVRSLMGEDPGCSQCDSSEVSVLAGRAIQVKDIEVV